jgi:hypothetical protein
MSWENENYVPNARSTRKNRHNPNSNLLSLRLAAKNAFPELPDNTIGHIMKSLTGDRIKAVSNNPEKLLFSRKLAKMLPKGQAKHIREQLRKNDEEALKPFFEELERARKERARVNKRIKRRFANTRRV